MSLHKILDRPQADRIIKDYIKPLYGFALNKTGNIAEVEELAGRITLEVYQTLLKKAENYIKALFGKLSSES